MYYNDVDFYFSFVELLREEFKETLGVECSRFDAVILTVPDSGFTWRDTYNDTDIHFLNPVRDKIERAGSFELFEIVTSYADRLILRAWNSFQCVYTYSDHLYVKSMFIRLTGCNEYNLDEIRIKVIHLLNSLYSNKSFSMFFEQHGLGKFLNGLELKSYEKIENKLNDLFICLNKLFSVVIIYSAQKDMPYDLDVCPSIFTTPRAFLNEYEKIKASILSSADYEEKFEFYLKLRNFVDFNGLDNEMQNFIANKFFIDFFRFINNCSLQDKLIFGGTRDFEDMYEMLQLYKMFDRHMKYALYRDHRNLGKDDGKGMMRYSLTERKIVLDYLKKRKKDINAEIAFYRSASENHKMSFVLRLANESDFENIHKINNPSEPYRRAIYVKSDDNEIEKAIKQNEAYVIEEVLNGNRTLACVAIILNSDNDHSDFNTEELCGRYAKSFMNTYGHRPKYLDFDSVITNNGSAGLGTKSYRGLGFQRLMLVLTEELAVIDNCDYVSATVSTLNNPSKRNFTLNGYEIANSDKYPFKGKGGTEYWDYLSKPGNEEKKRTYLLRAEKEYADNYEVMKDQKIDIDSYKHDKDVPRDFLVLPLKEKLIKHKS